MHHYVSDNKDRDHRQESYGTKPSQQVAALGGRWCRVCDFGRIHEMAPEVF